MPLFHQYEDSYIEQFLSLPLLQRFLQEDFNKYCKQIGISQSELPRLVTDRKTMDELKQTFKDKGRGRSTSNNYGICYWEDRTIYVNTNVRNHWGRMYSHVKYTSRQASKHKATYTDILHTLVHELVHYRFKYLQHGAKFEERIREILRGKVFPEKQIYTEIIYNQIIKVLHQHQHQRLY